MKKRECRNERARERKGETGEKGREDSGEQGIRPTVVEETKLVDESGRSNA